MLLPLHHRQENFKEVIPPMKPQWTSSTTYEGQRGRASIQREQPVAPKMLHHRQENFKEVIPPMRPKWTCSTTYEDQQGKANQSTE